MTSNDVKWYQNRQITSYDDKWRHKNKDIVILFFWIFKILQNRHETSKYEKFCQKSSWSSLNIKKHHYWSVRSFDVIWRHFTSIDDRKWRLTKIDERHFTFFDVNWRHMTSNVPITICYFESMEKSCKCFFNFFWEFKYLHIFKTHYKQIN